MNLELSLNKISFRKIFLFPVGTFSAYFIFACFAFSDYFISDTNVLIGIILSPFILSMNKSQRSIRYFIPAIILTVLSIIVGTRSILFLGFIFSVLFLVDSCIGKTSWTVMLLLFFISPVFKFLALTFGFPVRLFLSEASAQFLSMTGETATASGNIINFNGDAFSVDPACMGLSMLTISFILLLFIIAHFQRKTGSSFTLFKYCLLLTIAFGFNLICNLVRIILLVKFKLFPDSLMHDVIGIICLLVYVLIPIYWIVYLISKKTTLRLRLMSVIRLRSSTVVESRSRQIILNLFLIFSILFSFAFVDRSIPATAPFVQCSIPGFKIEKLLTGVIKFTNENNLVYVKPLNFYNAEHNPLICWSGSGYEFKSYSTEIVNGIEIYSGIIEKENEQIYSAWWFDNGTKKTISQFEWRLDAVKGNRYCLINANATSKKQLINLVTILLNGNIFKQEKFAL